ncbi:hypothetical protein [Sphingomonas glaciei]|uniref:Uncharacterized protein n=1 Tax=Sphingomonas glaciei TaxID=2938948 RepID=A0ABY5MSN1_9SPHN|nr:hypothetical protein [Sphingomonas glaciei]UUR06735.1 hypothetical protein M1K48_07130 [Sphingomonas glaciei]
MQMFDDEFVGGTIYSAVAPVTAEWLARVGDALDCAGTWRPTRGGGRDPGRSKVSSTSVALTEWFDSWITKRDGMWFYSDEKNEITGRIDAFAIDPSCSRRPLFQQIKFNAQETLFRDPNACNHYASTFAALCDASDAFLGWAAYTPMLRRSVENSMRLRQTKGAAPAKVAEDAHHLEYRLPDVRWLNYFGPSFIERYGPGIKGLGVRCDRTANGGAMVWATPTPFVFEEGATSFGDYPWKRPFYDALGAAFVSDDAVPGGRGEHVPSYADHLRHLSL